MYTGAVIPDDNTLPSYEILIGVWKLGQELRIGSLCDHTLDAMVKVRLATTRIPAAPLMVQVWKDTPAGCSVRKLLLSWAAEYMHTSDSKAQFAKSLPQDVLSELVLAMVPLYTSRLAQLSGFWARLVVPFKEPVHPVIDNVPDYFEKVTKPMDLHTMKSKMDKKRYTNNEEFLADMNQIFANCKAYWKPTDNVYAACEKLEKTFLKQYSKMNKWLAKLEGEEN
ncbi:Bromodomain-containing protein [Diaporthe sp. PMI_573]|nr:Bromodomain-containing protein [Diaporthaceae sp. PMI_573]